MKILIGICGIGNGHLSRQTNVLNLLKQNDNEIVIATTNDNIGYIKTKFPDLKVLEISIPWIACNEKGIDFETSINKYNESNINQYSNFLNFASNVEKAFSRVPDLVITDYEPNVAQYSYAVDIPLICMEQQSKFLYLDEIKISNYSILEEKKRINYFFPKYDYKIISSFFPINIKDKKVKIVTPIISPLEEIANKKNYILVYFSPYENSLNYIKVLDALKNISYYKIIVYTKEKFDISSENIEFKNYSTEFKNDLENSFCLISTAGHQLLSEAISIGIPVYLIPLSTYEQNYNAKMIEKYSLGEISKSISEIEINDFLKKVPNYKKKIIRFKNKYYKNNWEAELLNVINSYKKQKNIKIR